MTFDRVCKITAFRAPDVAIGGSPSGYFEDLGNGIEITDQRIQFRIEKTIGSEPNTAELTISNLSERTRADLNHHPLRVRIEAGHDQTPRLLFIGDVRPASPGSRIDETDWETKLLLGDGSRAFAHARVNRSYKSGTPMLTVLRDAAKSIGLTLPREILEDPQFRVSIATGEVLTGYTSDEITRLLAPYGYSWSIQGGRLQAVRDDQVTNDEARVINQESGMIGVPELVALKPKQRKKPAKKGPKESAKRSGDVILRHLLYPELVPGGLVHIQSRQFDGRGKLIKVTHEGDTHGNDWTTEIEVRAV